MRDLEEAGERCPEDVLLAAYLSQLGEPLRLSVVSYTGRFPDSGPDRTELGCRMSSRRGRNATVVAVPTVFNPGVWATGPTINDLRIPHSSRRAELMVAVPNSWNDSTTSARGRTTGVRPVICVSYLGSSQAHSIYIMGMADSTSDVIAFCWLNGEPSREIT